MNLAMHKWYFIEWRGKKASQLIFDMNTSLKRDFDLQNVKKNVEFEYFFTKLQQFEFW